MSNIIDAELVVIGAGPGGYSAAFRAADLGKKVFLIEKHSNLGGVCLNVGCIPSKALLHAAKTITDSTEMTTHGIEFTAPKVDIEKLRNWKNSVVTKLTSGLKMLAKKRGVTTLFGPAKLTSKNSLEVITKEGSTTINFTTAIVAAGSEPVNLPFIPPDPRIINSTAALALNSVPKNMLIIGGGIIGLEMATVYSTLGTQISIVEFMEQLIPGADADLIKPLFRIVKKKYHAIMLETKVTAVEAKAEGLLVTFAGKNAPEPQLYESVLVAVGRKPNGKNIGADVAKIEVDERGFIKVNSEFQTNNKNIYAIGDIIGNPMLAHKAVHEGRLVAEIICGISKGHTPKGIPSVAYTDPEVAWVGLTEKEALTQNLNYKASTFPWLACGRALSIGRTEGFTKLLFEKSSNKLLGAGIVGPNAGELIAELALALELGCTAQELARTIHPHPTLSETIMQAAEIFEGTVTDL